MAGTEKTNLSNDLRGVRLGTRILRNNSTEEWLIGSLCLENVARARGLLNQRQEPLEWLNLEAIAVRTIANININSWRTSSMDSNVAGQRGNEEQEPELSGANNNPGEGRGGNKEQEPNVTGSNNNPNEGQEKDKEQAPDLTGSNNNTDEGLGRSKEQEPSVTGSNNNPNDQGTHVVQGEPIPPSPQDPKTITRAGMEEERNSSSEKQRAGRDADQGEHIPLSLPAPTDGYCTPKRKLSPTIHTPLGRARKRSTTVHNSPELRSILDIQGQEAQQPSAPDLLTGIGRLRLRRGSNPSLSSRDKDGGEMQRETRKVIKAGSRLRTMSLTQEISSKNRQSRIRKKTFSDIELNIASPARQPKITEVFMSQKECKGEKEGENDEMPYDACKM